MKHLRKLHGLFYTVIILLFVFASCGQRSIIQHHPGREEVLSSEKGNIEENLHDEFARVLEENFGVSTRELEALQISGKAVSRPPTGTRNAVDDLTITDNGDGTFTLTWTYKNIGDYNQDGSVNVSDITPLAEHFQETAESEGDSWRGWIDGNGGCVMNIQDISPLPEHFLHREA